MIVVTGLPRSGTSLMMSILKDFDLPILGDKFLTNDDDDEKRKERAEYLNPEGFYEVRGTAGKELMKDSDKNTGEVIKIVVPGVLRTNPEKVEKMIFCLRSPIEIMNSQQNLVSNIEVFSEGEVRYANELTHIDSDQYNHKMSILIANADDVFWDKTLVVDYYDMIYDSKNQLKRIAKFLNIKDYDIKTNIKPSLHRQKFKLEDSDPFSLRIYNAIKNKDIESIKYEAEEHITKQKLQNVRWLDDTEFMTWTIYSKSLHYSLESNNNNVRDNLASSTNSRTLPTECLYYDPTGEEYTIIRPDEIEDLVRTKIICRAHKERENDFDREMTRETCFMCHQRYLMNKNNSRST